MVEKLKSKLANDLQLKELLSGSAVVFIFRILGLFSGYLLSYIITHYFGEEVLGVYSLSFTILSLVVVASRLGLDEALVKILSDLISKNKTGQAKDAYDKSVRLISIVSILLSIVVYQSADYIAVWFGNEMLIGSIKIVAYAITPYALIKVNADSLRGMKKMRAFSYLQVGSLLLFMSIFLLIGIFFFGSTNDLPFYALLAASLIMFFWSKSLIGKNFIVNEKGSDNYERLMKISLPMMLTSSMFLVLNWTDNLFLGRFLSEDQVGIYFIAFKFGLIISLSLFAVNSIAAPKFSELSSAIDTSKLRKLAMQSVKLNLWSAIPVFVLLIFSAEWLLSLYGSSFVVAKRCVYILAFGQLYNALSGSVLNFLNMTGHEKLVSKIIVSAALLNVVLNYYLIPWFESSEGWLGIEGAAISSMMCLIYWNSLGIYFVYKYHGFIMFPTPFAFKRKV
jgi:O-antigen/teichoic acid export membrane protein